MIHPPAHHNTHNNNTNSNISNNASTSKSLLSGSPNPSSASKKLLLLGEMHDPTAQDDDQDTTSVCSSVSSLTDDEDGHNTNNINGQAPTKLTLKKKSRFSICKAKTNLTPKNGTTTVSPVTNAVSISFLSSPNNNLKSSSTNTTGRQGQTNPKQVIQRALASLRPGGVFFVLDYKEEEDDVDSTQQAQSPSAQSQSRAMKEIPEDLLQKWNLTMVPSDLETFYNTRLSTKTSKLAPKVKAPLPASKRIVRWMGVKPVAPSRPSATN